MRCRPGPVLAVLLFCAHGAWPLFAQAPDDARSLLDAYAAIAERYAQGHAAAAADLLALGPERVKTLNDLMARAVRQRGRLLSSGARMWTPRLLRAAGMLHTEIAVQGYRDADEAVFDQHADAADRLFLLSEHGEPGNDFRPRWHLALGLYLLGSVDIDKARFFFARSCSVFPGHARLRLACGLSVATYARRLRPAQRELSRWFFDESHKAAEQVAEIRRSVIAEAELLETALRHFEAARSADPSLFESALRAAHVLMERRRDADAERMLAPLVTMDQPPALVYLARLMLGRIREKQGQRDAAATLYRQATEVLPDAPRARIALAQLLHATGDRTASRDIVERLIAPRLDPPEDPWTVYPMEFVATTYTTMDDLRREVRK